MGLLSFSTGAFTLIHNKLFSREVFHRYESRVLPELLPGLNTDPRPPDTAQLDAMGVGPCVFCNNLLDLLL